MSAAPEPTTKSTSASSVRDRGGIRISRLTPSAAYRPAAARSIGPVGVTLISSLPSSAGRRYLAAATRRPLRAAAVASGELLGQHERLALGEDDHPRPEANAAGVGGEKG